MAISPVSSNSVPTTANTANGSFEKAVQTDASVTVDSGGRGGLSGDFAGKSVDSGPNAAAKPGTGDFFGDSAKQVSIGDDLFE